jgi:hypothetical protein
MNELDTPFGLADGLDRKRPEIRVAAALELYIDAQPFVGQPQRLDVPQVQHGAKVSEALPIVIKEKSVVCVSRQTGKV